MSLIQWILLVCAAFAAMNAARQFRGGILSALALCFWLGFWGLVGVAVALPQTTQLLARVIGVGRGVDAIMYVSILALFYLVFRLVVRLEEQERELTKLVRALALKEE